MWGVLALVGLVVAILLVVSTARPVTKPAPSAGQTPTATPGGEEATWTPQPPEPVQVTLPRIPTPTRDPMLYDENGCLLGPEGEVISCPAPPLPEPTEHAEPDHVPTQEVQLDWRYLYGFQGPYYATELKAGKVIVLEETISTTVEGKWRAWGLVRNEVPEPVGQVVVKASLVGADGAVLDTPSAEVPVDPLRPGEPGPFAITSTVEAERVASVEWSVESGPPNPRVPPEARQVELLIHWEVPYGDREPSFFPLCKDEGDPPYLYLLSGDTRNLGPVELPDPRVVAAWLDEDSGRVVWVAETELHGCISCPPLPVLRPDGIGSNGAFCFAIGDAEIGPRLFVWTDYMLWGVGR